MKDSVLELSLATPRILDSDEGIFMRIVTYGIALTLVVVSSQFAIHAQAQAKLQLKGGVVSGTVTLKGKPIPGIVVVLREGENDMQTNRPLRAKTDQAGKYRITGVPSGPHYVTPATPGFVVADADDSTGLTVVLTHGETVEGIDFELVRGGVITGRVLDFEGRAAVEHHVFLIDVDHPQNQRRAFRSNQTFTDDRGIYRIFAIPAGRYKVGASPTERGYRARLSGGTRGRAFYADVTEESKATIIEITESSEVSNINIILGRSDHPTLAVSGKVIDGETGQPIAGLRVGMQYFSNDGGSSSFFSNLMRSNSKGDFRIDNLSAGKYGVFVVPESGGVRSDVVHFEILDQDVSEIVVKTTKIATSLRGVVVLENSEDREVLSRLLQLQITAHKWNSLRGIDNSSSISPDGSFSLDNLEPGIHHISLSGSNFLLMKGFHVSKIERNGIVESSGIEIKRGDQITDVRVVITYGSATVQGVVKLEDGPLPAGAEISVRATKEGTNVFVWPEKVDGRGHFIMEGLPAGLYSFETYMFLSGVTGKPKPPVKQQVNIVEGAVNEVTITLKNSNLTPIP